ncbi:HAMP domain-containing sensor histidine kinase [Flavobacterium sp.]|uniref:sensor histidine kinase n=1 Tax=Flavobacterium sp. TaxID=239 RepID=UPI00261AF45A|nr:HAMP domain-containing sensor histidine kinase [Flavobacterium sp.]MDD3003969.1 HAMP domain-containing sensor histidine kinase [Flavobacterium sp.]
MNKLLFRLLVFLMSLSLIGIILVQLYLIHTSFKNNEEQFKFHVKQVIGNVADNFKEREVYNFLSQYNMLKETKGKQPTKTELLDFYVVQKNRTTNKTIIYSNSILSEDYNINLSFFDKQMDSVNKVKNFVANSKTEVFSGSALDKNQLQLNPTPEMTTKKSGQMEILDKVQYQMFYEGVIETKSIKDRVSIAALQKALKKELKLYDVNTAFEFGIYENGLATKLKSADFKFDKNSTFAIPFLTNSQGKSDYQLLVSFPDKKKFLFSELIGITTLSIIFTLIIIIAYSSALNQLIKQRQISEIKTDFINNMTHEFKTPIATINLALDAIKSPKVIEDREKTMRYLQMIRDENKRMHAQVENVLRISKLEKRELEISKESTDIHDIIEEAIEHVNLIIEDRNGTINTHLNAKRTTVLLNDVHFTNVIVNVLDNAIKYSPEEPKIDVYTENVKDFIIIKVKDQGAGMNKMAQKRIFEKFYREHTGDIHNVKGHGLGLAYVKRIVEDHNGLITVESEKGKGSTFIIKLPLIN